MADFDVNVDEVLADPNLLAFLEKYGNSFRVTALPDDVRNHPEASHFYIYVEYRSPGRWAVLDFMHSKALSKSGEWEWEGSPSSRTDKFKKVTRFPLTEAFKLAQEAAKNIRINRFDVAAITEHVRKWQVEEAAQEAAEKAARKAAKAEKKAQKKTIED
jgi:hypothetical protein